MNLFDTRIQWHGKGFPYEIFPHSGTKNFRRKNLTLPPPSYPIIFLDTRPFLKHSTKLLLCEMIWFCEAKTFRRKILTKPSKAWIFSMAENNDTLKGSTMKVFGSVRQAILDRNSWYSPFLSIDFFATGKILKHSTEALLYEMFRHCETKIFRRKKSWLFPFLLIHKLFRYQKFFGTEHRRVPLRKVSVLWDKKVCTNKNNRDITFWSIKLFDKRK